MPAKNDNLVHVMVKRGDRKGFVQFLVALEEKINEGYELVQDGQYAPRPSYMQAWLKKKGEVAQDERIDQTVVEEVTEKVAEERAPVKALEDLKGKAELLAFAEEAGVEIPEGAKSPLAIKKVLKLALQDK